MEGSTNTAEAVERITNTLAYARSVGNNDRNSYPFRVGDVDRLLSRITEMEKGWQVVSQAQDILAEYIVPDSGISDAEVVNRLLGLLDREDVVLAARAASRLLTEGAK